MPAGAAGEGADFGAAAAIAASGTLIDPGKGVGVSIAADSTAAAAASGEEAVVTTPALRIARTSNHKPAVRTKSCSAEASDFPCLSVPESAYITAGTLSFTSSGNTLALPCDGEPTDEINPSSNSEADAATAVRSLIARDANPSEALMFALLTFSLSLKPRPCHPARLLPFTMNNATRPLKFEAP